MILRRNFITLLGGAAAWPLAASAQQPKRIGVLMSWGDNDLVAKTYVSTFTQALADLGWMDGRNVRADLRWAGSDPNRIRGLAQELVRLQPNVILAAGTPATAAVQRETRTIPIVFTGVADPVTSGIVLRLDRPSGNVTGFARSKPRWEASGLSCFRRSRRGSTGRNHVQSGHRPRIGFYALTRTGGAVTQGRANHCARS